ncbi:MAG: 2-hydroxy-3-oxopropionate reductase [candidate division NC10 bacterium]|jgi:2-hydroxy-3-oxopropionate reductase|nr:2-hydroxy-3-oxopropionate reductase [candidate division NC10 bacterium]
MSKKIGFIGLGIMGKPMARNLLKAGYTLNVYSRSQPPMEELKRDGATLGASPKEVAAASEVVITMLPNSPDVEAVVLGANGVLEGTKSGTILADMSTISPLVSQKIYEAAKKKGVKALDAPVSGGEKGAIEGILSIMVGGDSEVYEAAVPIFQVMGKTITYMGPAGAGGFTKLANQVIVAINLTAIGEALTLGAKAGLDPQRLIQALSGGMAGSRCLDMKGPQITKGNFQPGFTVDLHYKDLGLIMEAARALQVPLPTTAVVQELFSALRVKGRGALDHSAVITLLEDLAGAKARTKS